MQFDFAENWAHFSDKALNAARVEQARRDFHALLEPVGQLAGRTFLDIGFGQGLSLLCAAADGAIVRGMDVNPACSEVLSRNRQHYPELGDQTIPVTIGSILSPELVFQMKRESPGGGGYDVVHAWGVLHHTGNMAEAITNAVSLVKERGYFAVALYNRHWSSGAWRAIKYVYCRSPRPVRKLLVLALFPVILVAKWIVTGSNPFTQSRGMDFHFNVIDWVGGYPYEFASAEEVIDMLEKQGMRCVGFIACKVPTGCNEFVFQRCQDSVP